MSLKEAQELVAEFHRKFGATIGQFPQLRDKELRDRLAGEEYGELHDELIADNPSLPRTCKEACDLIYVALGLFVAAGVDAESCFREVHRSNMTKTPGNFRADGKVLKGEGYSPADIESVLRAQGWRPENDSTPGETPPKLPGDSTQPEPAQEGAEAGDFLFGPGDNDKRGIPSPATAAALERARIVAWLSTKGPTAWMLADAITRGDDLR